MGLEFHPEKTRLIEFGRFAESNRRTRGEGKPETFDFLGFTHYCGSKKGRFIVWRKTAGKRMRAKLQQLKQELRRRMHEPVAQVGEWLGSVQRGYYQYHAVPGNRATLGRFRHRLFWLWWQVWAAAARGGCAGNATAWCSTVGSYPTHRASLPERSF